MPPRFALLSCLLLSSLGCQTDDASPDEGRPDLALPDGLDLPYGEVEAVPVAGALPTSTFVYLKEVGDAHHIYAYDLATDETWLIRELPVRVTGRIGLSPDRTQIVFAAPFGFVAADLPGTEIVWRLSVDGEDLQRITPPMVALGFEDYRARVRDVSFGPDGTSVLYAVEEAFEINGEDVLFIRPNLAPLGGGPGVEVNLSSSGCAIHRGPSISPKGTTLAAREGFCGGTVKPLATAVVFRDGHKELLFPTQDEDAYTTSNIAFSSDERWAFADLLVQAEISPGVQDERFALLARDLTSDDVFYVVRPNPEAAWHDGFPSVTLTDDGTLVYCSGFGDGVDLFALDLTTLGAKPRPLTTDGVSCYAASRT